MRDGYRAKQVLECFEGQLSTRSGRSSQDRAERPHSTLCGHSAFTKGMALVALNPDRRRSNQRCASGEQVEIDRVWRLRSKYVMPPPSYRHSTLVQPRNGYEKGDISSAVRPCGSQCCQPLQIRSPAVCARTLRSAKSTPGIARLDIRTTPLTITVSTSSPTPHSTRLLMGSCTGP